MLTFLAYIYRVIWHTRKRLYSTSVLKPRRLPCPVICVGNLTVGGTGKTPTVITLARLLQDNLHHIAVLSRGYKRRSHDSILVVSDGSKIISTPQEAGDEPYLIASALKNVPVIAGADRYHSGLYAIDHFGTNLFILDDGYQHLKLHRDINILLIDAANPWGNGYLLPKGILREPFSGISRADCVIITRANEGDKRYVDELVRLYNHNSPIFCASYRPAGITDLKGNNLGHDYISGKKVLLFAGIANPKSFRRCIEDIGGRVKGEVIYPDHYWYSDKDIEKIFNEAFKLSVDAIMTTAKDAVRLTGADFPTGMDKKIEILVLHVEMEIDRGFEERIKGHLGHKN